MKNGLFWILSLVFMLSGFMDSKGLQESYKKARTENAVSKLETSSLGELEIEYGIKGYLRINSAVRVKVSIKNAKKNFDGSVHLKYYSVGGALSSYSEKIKLKKGEETLIYFYPFLNTVAPSFTVAFLDERGKEIESFDDDIEKEKIDEISELAVASLLTKDKKNSLIGEKDFRLKRLYLNESQIEGDYRTLSSFDLLIKPDDYENILQPKTIETIKEWERWGGISITEKDAVNFNLNRLYLGREDGAEWTWRVERVLMPVLENLNIKTGKYIAIILIYIIVIGPVTYFILARRNRRVEYWIFVPIWSIIFTAIIYMIGTESRIDGVYMNYVSVIDLRRGKQTENVAFSVTNSSNMPYKLGINNGYKVESLYGSYSKPDWKMAKRVMYNIENKSNGADINVKEATAFDTLFLKAHGTPEIGAENAGEIYRDEGGVKGEFKNKLGTDLKKVFAIYDDEIIYIGDVAKGETRSFTSKNVFLNDINAKLQDSLFLNKIFDFAYEGENPKIQTLMTSVLGRTSILGEKTPSFVALADVRLRGEFAYDVNNVNGYTLLVLPAEKLQDKGIASDKFINSIGKLPMSVGEENYSFYNGALLNRNSIDISYKLDNMKVKCLSLLSRYKEDVNPCKVYLLNHLTGNFDAIFSADDNFVEKIKERVNNGGEAELDRGKDQQFSVAPVYIENGKITLRYEVEQTAYDEISAFSIPDIPKISMEYE